MKKRRYVILSLLFLSGIISFIFFKGNQVTEDTQIKGNQITEDTQITRVHVEPEIDFFQPSQQTHFPVSEGLKPQVEFWKKIFSKYTSQQAVIHDRRHVGIVYTVIDLTKKQVYSQRARKKAIRSAKKKYKRMLLKMKKLKPGNIGTLTEEEQKIFSMIKEVPGNYRFDRAKRNIRVQYGLKDSFQKALVNSTPYLKEMERIFSEHGLPVELTRLPFAESSFNLEARSLAPSHRENLSKNG
jgi:membrane-bound lytic murein transglycosylase D